MVVPEYTPRVNRELFTNTTKYVLSDVAHFELRYFTPITVACTSPCAACVSFSMSSLHALPASQYNIALRPELILERARYSSLLGCAFCELLV